MLPDMAYQCKDIVAMTSTNAVEDFLCLELGAAPDEAHQFAHLGALSLQYLIPSSKRGPSAFAFLGLILTICMERLAS